ncbi:hypothetical protein LNV09_14585 [Paucibacter sp. B2R-40]|uniref:hypothetical protein n=1 Tax=Paucibacter sp. B2R-40 TaxID=2893554 RepID=UPI0021E4D184|nr:hypothetical protein [Paucibacter sp. B2R-40]MCV2355378.1 hypothetical protein [Paucibacter sp. B2R-40]
MNDEKRVSVSFRVTPHFKRLLEAAAKLENRSQTNMLETLVFAYGKNIGLEDATKNMHMQGEKIND